MRTAPVIQIIFHILSTILGLYSAKSPHIVFILSDDVGWNDFSLHGSQQCKTPYIDELASDSVILDNYYTMSVCSPTRASLLTGRHVTHTGVYQVYGGVSNGFLNLSFPLLPQYLKSFGYASHAIGKWHLGINKKSVLPQARGFDSHFGFLTGGEDHSTHVTQNAVDFFDGFDPTVSYQNVYSTPLFTEKAISIIEQFGNKSETPTDQPLFLYLAYQDSHWPQQAPEEFYNMFPSIPNKQRQGICAMGAHLDLAVHNITEALKENGLWDDTLFIFANDNGGPTNGDENSNNNNYPLRGGKDSLWQGGVRSLAFVRGYGIQKTGYHHQDKFDVTDWLPTILSAIIGNDSSASWTDYIPSSSPALALGDGLNNWPMLSTGAPSARDWVLLETHPASSTSRSHGDGLIVGDWKLLKIASINPVQEYGWPAAPGEDTSSTNYSVNCNGKQPSSVDGSQCTKNYCLFNIAEDPCEYSDVASKYPDKVEELTKTLQSFQASAVEAGTSGPCNPITVKLDGIMVWTYNTC